MVTESRPKYFTDNYSLGAQKDKCIYQGRTLHIMSFKQKEQSGIQADLTKKGRVEAISSTNGHLNIVTT